MFFFYFVQYMSYILRYFISPCQFKSCRIIIYPMNISYSRNLLVIRENIYFIFNWTHAVNEP